MTGRPSDAEELIASLLRGGDDDHLASTMEEAGPLLERIAMSLHLLAIPLESLFDDPAESTDTPNTLAALACLASCFRGLRASTLLAVHGYTTESRTVVRRVYESAALARMLAKEPQLAEQWLHKVDFPDKSVRRWFERGRTGRGRSEFHEFYSESSAYAHPTVRSTLPLLLTDDPSGPPLDTGRDSAEAITALKEIASEGVFVCFALKNALVNPTVLAPEWHRTLAELAEAGGADVDHLTRDWDADEARYSKLLESVIPAEDLDSYLAGHPNSAHNIMARAESRVDAESSATTSSFDETAGPSVN